MINTIFYFVNDFDTYQLKVLQHDISAKTIVFVEDQLAIYKDGKRYGNMGYDDIKEKVIEIVTNDEDGKRAAGGAYDDSGLIEALDRIDAITKAEQERLSNLIQQLDTEILEKVNSMFDDAQWIRENVAQNEYLHQDMTWIGDEINAYLQQVGYWTTDSNGNTITQWSKIQQSVDSINTNVNALSQNVDGRFTAVQSAINQSVDQKIQTAKTEISNMYALGQDVNDIKKVVEWMYSGLKSSAGPTQSIAQIVSAGQGAAEAAISDMRTLVNKLENGDYVATGSLTTQVLNSIEGYIATLLSTAGLTTLTTLADALTTVFSRLDNHDTGLSGISSLETRVHTLENGGFIADGNLVTAITNHKADIIASAGLATKAQYDALGNTYLAKADLITEIANKAGQITSLAGFITQSTLNSAIATVNAKFQDPANNITGWSTLTNKVSDLEGGGFISENDLASKIASHKEDIITSAGLATSAQIEGLGNTYLAKANLVAEITNKAGQISTSAGLQLKSDLDDAVAALVSLTSSTKAAIEVIATGNSSSITVNADDINMTASHKLSLNSDFLNIASNFYSTIANNITLTADKITIDGQHQLDLTSLNLSIAGDQITMSSSHPLALNTTGVTVNGQPFFNAISNELNVDSVVTNKLTSGTGTFKGNVEADSFIAGPSNQAGIAVTAQFDPSTANTNKVYFAYDSSQQAPSMFIYDPSANNGSGMWRVLSFTKAFKDDTFFARTYYSYANGNTTIPIPTNTTQLSASDFSEVTLYYNYDDNRYYTTLTSNVSDRATGKYLINPYPYLDPGYYYDHTSSGEGTGTVNTQKVPLYVTTIAAGVGNDVDSSAARGVFAEITVYRVGLYHEFGTGSTAGIKQPDVEDFKLCSPDAVLSCTIDANGHVTNVVRGFAFLQITHKIDCARLIKKNGKCEIRGSRPSGMSLDLKVFTLANTYADANLFDDVPDFHTFLSVHYTDNDQSIISEYTIQ